MNLLLVFWGRLAQFALGLLGVRVLTTLLAPDEMGRVALVITATTLFALILVNPVGTFINRRLHAWVDGGTVYGHFRWYGAYLCIVALIAAPIMIAISNSGIIPFGIDAMWLVVLVSGSLLFNTMNQTVIPSLNMVGHTRPFMALTLGTISASLVVASGLALVWRPTAEAWLSGVLFGQMLFGVIGYKVFFHYVKAKNSVSPLTSQSARRLYHFAWPVAISVGFNWMHMQGYRFLLADAVGVKELGIFAAGYGVAAALLAAMELVLSTYFQPIFYKQANASDFVTQREAWNQYAAVMLPAALLGVAAVIAAAPYLTAVLLGISYQSATRYVMLGAVAEGARMLVGLFGLIAHQRMKTIILIVPNALGAAISTTTVWLLLPVFGMDVAPLGAAMGGLVVVLYIYFSANADLPISINCRQTGNAIGLGLALVLMVKASNPYLAVFGGLAKYLGLLLVAACVCPAGYWLLHTRLAVGNSRKSKT